jgi:hypothetical protein
MQPWRKKYGRAHVFSIPNLALLHCDDRSVPVLDQLLSQVEVFPLKIHERVWRGVGWLVWDRSKDGNGSQEEGG